MTSYIIIMLALGIQTDRTAPAQWFVLLQQAQSEYIGGHFAVAEGLFVDALGQIPQSDVRQRAKVLGDLGNVYTEQEAFSKAERTYSQSLSLSEQLSDSSNSALMLQNLGVLYSLEGRNDEALRFVARARQLAQSAVLSDPKKLKCSLVLESFNITGTIHARRKRPSMKPWRSSAQRMFLSTQVCC